MKPPIASQNHVAQNHKDIKTNRLMILCFMIL